jgi:hypothetical protein
VQAKPTWIEQNLAIHKAFCTDVPREEELNRFKLPKNKKKRAASKVDEDPYCTLIQKMMHAFGDYDWSSNFTTAKSIEEYLKSFWVDKFKHPGRSDIDQEFMVRVFAKEIQSFKKLKSLMKDVEDYQNKEAEYDISFIPKEDLDEKLYDEEQIAGNQQLENDGSDIDDEEDKIGAEDDFEGQQRPKEEGTDALHEERVSFYSQLADSMDSIQYDVFSKCRQQNFLSKGKDGFLDWIGTQWSKPFAEYFSHLAYNEVRIIVEHSIRQLSYSKTLHRIGKPLALDAIEGCIEQRKHEIKQYIESANESKGKKAFVKHYAIYFRHRDHFQENWNSCVAVSRNKKKGKVLLKIKKDKAWYPISKNEEAKHRQLLKSKGWKNDSKLYREASEKWILLTSEEKSDYTLRRIGEDQALGYMKSKQADKKFIPNNPYAAFIEEKITEYSQESGGKVKIDHKMLEVLFAYWQTLSKSQKQVFIDKYKE